MLLDKHEQEQENEITELKRAVSDLQQKVMLLQPLEAHAVDIDGDLSEGIPINGIHLVGSGTISLQPPSPMAPEQIFEATIPHGLTGYRPQVLGVMTFPTNMDPALDEVKGRTVQLPWYSTFPESGIGGVTSLEFYMYTDDTNVVARVRSAFPANQLGWGGPYLFYYYLVKQDWQ